MIVQRTQPLKQHDHSLDRQYFHSLRDTHQLFIEISAFCCNESKELKGMDIQEEMGQDQYQFLIFPEAFTHQDKRENS